MYESHQVSSREVLDPGDSGETDVLSVECEQDRFRDFGHRGFRQGLLGKEDRTVSSGISFSISREDEEVLGRFYNQNSSLTSEEVGEAIQNLRVSRLLTQSDLAKRISDLGWKTCPSQNYISRIEKGYKSVSLEFLCLIARCVEVSVSRLFWEAERCAARNLDRNCGKEAACRNAQDH